MSNDGLVLELICNLRWVVSYIVQRLDPVVEKHYVHTIEQARRVDAATSRSFATARSLSDLPAEALTLAQEGVAYLLVAEGVLGYCPPTMHSFLLRGGCPGASVPLSGYVSCNSSASSASLPIHSTAGRYQAQFLVVRWLTAQGILTDEELLDAMGEGGEVPLDKQEGRFGLHMAMAKRLSVECAFSSQAHVLITRSLLLYYCSTLITVEDVELHISFLDGTCNGELSNMEDALRLWLFCLLRNMHIGGTISDEVYKKLKESGDSLYKTVHSGIILALALSFYKPHLLPPNVVSGDAPRVHKGCHPQQRFEHWGKVLRVSEELGLVPGLYADEAGEYGSVTLQLHVLRFIGELFAMLATQAEDVEGFCAYALRSQHLHASADSERWRAIKSDDRNKSCVDLSLSLGEPAACSETDRDTIGPDHRGRSIERTRSVNGSVIYSSFPSALNRRQYNVMKVSLLLRSAERNVTSPESCSSPLRRQEKKCVSSTNNCVVMSGEEFFPRRSTSPQHRITPPSGVKGLTYAGLVNSSTAKARASVAKEWWKSNGEVEVSPRSTSGMGSDALLNSAVVQISLPPGSGCVNSSGCGNGQVGDLENMPLYSTTMLNVDEDEISGVTPRIGHSDMLSPLSSVAFDIEAAVGFDRSHITSESSFQINTVERECTPYANNAGVSPLSPIVMTGRSKNCCTPHRSSLSEAKEPTTRGEPGIDDLLSEVHSVYLTPPVIDDRQKLLETLEHQRVLIERLARELQEARETNTMRAMSTPSVGVCSSRTITSIMCETRDRLLREAAAGPLSDEGVNATK